MSSIVSSTTSMRNTPTQFAYDSETVDNNNTNNVISKENNNRTNSNRQHTTTSIEAINGTTSVVTTKISTDDTLSSSPSSYTSNNYTNSNTNVTGIRPNDNNNNNNNKKTIVIQTPKREKETETVSPTQIRWGDENIIKENNITKENTDNDNNNDINNNHNNNTEKSDTIEPDFEYKFDSQKIVTLSTDKLIQMLTALLEKIINSNDRLNHNSNSSSLNLIDNNDDPETNSLINSIISFKGKHVPQIGLEQYFHRIQKYCPTTNDVFLSLLIYFDRISKKCNSKLQEAMTTKEQQQEEETSDHEQNHLDNNSLIETEDKELLYKGEKCAEDHEPTNETNENQQQTFVMDSYNIHRLIIAGVTVSTKFFSDFFYSNSRYARVGGISLKEMNHLELQFLVLCDFEMLISVEEMERYANLLYRFWDSDNNNNASSNTD